MSGSAHIDFITADEAWRRRIREQWGEVAARHMHITDGFSILALYDGEPVGLISVTWRELASPLPATVEGYIDIIEVAKGFRRQRIATRLIELCTERARAHGAYQLRAWSSDDKVEAIPMWRALGFGLCPATIYPGGQEVRGIFVTRVL